MHSISIMRYAIKRPIQFIISEYFGQVSSHSHAWVLTNRGLRLLTLHLPTCPREPLVGERVHSWLTLLVIVPLLQNLNIYPPSLTIHSDSEPANPLLAKKIFPALSKFCLTNKIYIFKMIYI